MPRHAKEKEKAIAFSFSDSKRENRREVAFWRATSTGFGGSIAQQAVFLSRMECLRGWGMGCRGKGEPAPRPHADTLLKALSATVMQRDVAFGRATSTGFGGRGKNSFRWLLLRLAISSSHPRGQRADTLRRGKGSKATGTRPGLRRQPVSTACPSTPYAWRGGRSRRRRRRGAPPQRGCSGTSPRRCPP